MKVLEKIKAFITSDWSQVVTVTVAIVSIIATISGKMIDSAKVAEVVGQVGIAIVGVIWLIETIINAVSALKKKG